MKELKALLSRLNSEESTLVKELVRIRTMKAALLAGDDPAVAEKTKGEAPKARKAKKRAPGGALANAVKLALADKPEASNKELRAAVTASGYEWPVNVLHVSKTLARLILAGEVSYSEKEGRRVYSLAKPHGPAAKE